MTTVTIAGGGGRMGHTLIRCIATGEDLRLGAAVECEGHPDLGKDVGVLAGLEPAGILLTSALDAALPDADVMIDFTLHTAVAGNVTLAAELGKPTVIGTTGLDETEKQAVYQAANRIPVLWAPNMSLGINLLFAVLKQAAAVCGAGYAVEIDETHHVHKKDAPSGTALRLAEKVAEGRGAPPADVMVHDTGERPIENAGEKIVMRSHREGEVIGVHAVTFSNAGECITFTHEARSRDAFAMGALQAAKWVVGKPAGLYDMQDVLGL